MQVGLIGEPVLLALHATEGSFDWGRLRVLDERAAAERFEPDAVFGLGEVPPAQRAAFDACPLRAVWKAEAGDALDGVATVAPGGRGLWRIAPLPARDELYELPPAPASGVLVTGGDEQSRNAAVVQLSDHGHEVRAVAMPAPGDLAGVAVVAVLPQGEAPLPSLAFAVLASGRLLLAPPATPSFGLAPGIDYLEHSHVDEVMKIADTVVAFPGTFDSVIAMGRERAETQRASAVYGRLAADLGVA